MNYRITEEQQNLVREYIDKLELEGKSTRRIKVVSRAYFDYLNNRNIDHCRISVREAQEYQSYLMTRTNEDGSIRYAKATVGGIISAITSFYDYLRITGQIYINPFREIDRVKIGKPLPRNILTEEAMSLFLKHLRDFHGVGHLTLRKKQYKFHVAAELMYSTGARIHEVMALKPGDIDFDRGIVNLVESKTGTVREGILNSYAEKVLRIYVERLRKPILESSMAGRRKGDKTLLFGSSQSLVKDFNEFLQQASESLGYGKFSSHNFRHAVGYHLLRAGCDIRFIQDILGHRDLRTTQIYTKVDKEDLKSILDRFHPRVLNKREMRVRK